MTKRISTRREVLRAGASFLAASGLPLVQAARGAGADSVNMQLGWIIGGNQLGEVAAKRLGYFKEANIDFSIQPGGPNIDGVAIVASGRYEIGQLSSSPSLLLAASQGLPVTCFAVGAQTHPYAFFSLPRAPIRKPRDMIGRRVGIQATGQPLLSALLRRNGVPEDKVEKVIVGSDMRPLLAGQVDAFAGWITNTTALKPLGPDYIVMRLWDWGVKLYALPYYATTDTLTNKADVLARFLKAAARGWAFARENPDKAVDLLVQEYPNLAPADERAAATIMLSFEFTPQTAGYGWGGFDPKIWQDQIDLYDQLKQFPAGKPKLDAVMTTKILDMTAADRPKIG